MVSLLSSNHSKILIRLFYDEKTEHSGRAIVNFFLDLSSSPGFYPVDETVSILPVNFWYHFYDEVTSIDSSRVEQIFVPIFSRLLEILIVKLKMAPNFHRNWSSNEREQYFYYRQEISDTVICCYRILGANMTSYLLASAKNTDNETVESILFFFDCICDYVSVKDMPAVTFLTQIFPLLNISDQNREISLKLVGKYCDLIMELYDEATKLKTVDYFVEISTISLQNTNFCAIAISSLHNLCKSIMTDENQLVGEWLKIMEKVVIRSTECFNNESLDYHSRLEALTCAGIILSCQSRDAILTYLNALLTPRLLKMQNLFSSNSNQSEIPQLLFQFDVISTLIASLKKKSSKNLASPTTTPNNESPVYLVMAQSLDLFSTILDASRCDEKIAEKLCDLFAQCLTCLHLDARNLIAKISGILLKIFPPYETAIDVVGKLLLIFSCGATSENVTIPLFQIPSC
uniref:MMS19 nucleotide excision repair protein n=1 Tax=Romanomermis culicivorax TaxID=13658 RepID=A0A915JZR9_ROMCU